MLHGSDWKKADGDGKNTLLALPALQGQLLEQEDGKTRWNQVITELSRALMNAPAFTLRAACRQSVSLRSAALCAEWAA
jgi:type I restriction enzyme R subunit